MKKALRNRLLHASGDPYFDLTMQNFQEFYAQQRREQKIKEAEEAGLSPGAYMDDEVPDGDLEDIEEGES